MQKLIEKRKQLVEKNKNIKHGVLSLEGALGKIAITTVKNPRPLIVLKGPDPAKEEVMN